MPLSTYDLVIRLFVIASMVLSLFPPVIVSAAGYSGMPETQARIPTATIATQANADREITAIKEPQPAPVSEVYPIPADVSHEADINANLEASPSALLAGEPQIEVGTVSNVGSSNYVTVTLDHSYTAMVVIATANYSNNSLPLLTRVRNAQGTSFQVKLQNPSEQALQPETVHYLVMESGSYTLPDGRLIEAQRVDSTVTDGKWISWQGQSLSYGHSYTNPVVLGQVMSENDLAWSVFWQRGSSRTSPPNSNNLWVGKMVGEDSDTTRATEMLGVVIIEAGAGDLNGVAYQAGLGPDTVRGVTNSPPYAYNFSPAFNSSPQVALISQAAMDGNNGGWAVLYGATPLSTSSLELAIDEDQINDSERRHITEQVAYLVFEQNLSYPPQLPVADFYASPLNGTPPLTVTFTNNSTGATGYLWRYGDGLTNTTTAMTHTHTYTQSGIYTVTLRATYLDNSDTLTRVAYITINPTEVVTATIDSSGGSLVVPSNGVQIDIPPGAVTETMVMTYTEMAAEVVETVALTTFVTFALEASTVSTPVRALTTLSQPITVTVPYTDTICDAQTDPDCEDLVTLFWRQEGTGVWYPIKSSQALTGANRVVAGITRFAEVTVMGTDDTPLGPPEGLTLPSVSGSGSSEFTGGATVNVPLEIPPVAGRSLLNLSLSYSSDVINSIRNSAEAKDQDKDDDGQVDLWHYRTQASVYGLGWTLSGLPSIGAAPMGPFARIMQLPSLNINGSDMLYYNYNNSYPYVGWASQSLSFNKIDNNRTWGGDWTDGNGKWGEINEFYWDISGTYPIDNDLNPYTVKDHAGNKYVFAQQQRSWDCNREEWRANGFYITEIRDPHSNTVKINYFREGADNAKCNLQNMGINDDYDRAIFPSLIQFFPTGAAAPTVKIEFANIKSRPEGIYMDQDQYRRSEEVGQPFYSKYRITAIKVYAKSDDNTWSLYRTYNLDNNHQVMMPVDKSGTEADETNWGHMLLRSINISGTNGASFPATTFKYNTDGGTSTDYDWNHTRLTEVDNGYGGRVAFDYENKAPVACGGYLGGNLGRYVVKTIKTYDGLGGNPVSQSSFSYNQPNCRIDYLDDHNQERKKETAVAWFMGYGQVTKTNQDGVGSVINTVESLYHTTQSRANVGDIPHAAA